jgi:lysophospholipase L1-like esterase
VKSFAFGLLVAVLGGLALLVTAEFALRATGFGLGGGEQRALHELRLDRPWFFGLRPGARVTLSLTGDVVYEINADGFRDRRYPRTASARDLRMLLLGASITFGWGVDSNETYAKRLEALLAERAGQRVEVLNFGVNGYNPYNQAALLADRGLGYEPDLVLAEFCVAGIQDPKFHFDAQTRMHLGMIPEEAFPEPSMRRPPPRWARLVHACRTLRVCALLDDAFLALSKEEPKLREILPTLVGGELPPGPTRSWLRDRYTEMAQSAHSVGAGFGVVAFPYQAQVYGSISGLLQERLVELGREAGWPTLDLVPVFRRAAEAGAPPLFLDQWHPSAAGHRVAAEAIADWLERDEAFAF